jgi:hypothetical protein
MVTEKYIRIKRSPWGNAEQEDLARCLKISRRDEKIGQKS